MHACQSDHSFGDRPIEMAENASELQFGGEDLDNEETGTTCLSNAEVAILLDKQRASLEEQSEEATPVFKQTLEYALRFSGTSDPVSNAPAIEALRDALMNFECERDGGKMEKLHSFEIAALSNLAPEDYDEVEALIPSIYARFREDEIEQLLELLSQNLEAS